MDLFQVLGFSFFVLFMCAVLYVQQNGFTNVDVLPDVKNEEAAHVSISIFAPKGVSKVPIATAVQIFPVDSACAPSVKCKPKSYSNLSAIDYQRS